MIPDTLTDKRQWVCWQYQCRECWTIYDGKRDECPACGDEVSKMPVDPESGDLAKSDDPDTWTDFATAKHYHSESSDIQGVGFVFDPEGLVAGVDLDDCRDPDTGEIDEWARDVVDTLDSFTEVSPSETGLHIYVVGFLPDGGSRSDVGGGEIEMYDGKSARYFTVTGDHFEGTPKVVQQRNDALGAVHDEYVADDTEDTQEAPENTPDTGLDEGELIEKAKNAENGDKFRRLWNGQTCGYESHSEARQALANLLAFWTGGDKRQMLGLFKQSGLYRDEDDERTFKNYEIPTALEGRTEFYDPEKATDGGATATAATAPEPQPDTNDSGIEYELTAAELLALLGYDPEDDSLKDPSKHELANGIEMMLRERDDIHLCLLDTVDSKDQPIYRMDDEAKVWENKGERRLARISRRVLGVHNRSGVQNELENALRSNPSGRWLMNRDELGVEVGYLPVKNGVLDLETRELREARPEDYLLGRLPVEYDPEAAIEDTRFKEFLLQSVKSDDRDKLQEYAGYTLLKNAQPYKKALFLIGPTDSGKGTFLKTVEHILGEENVASETLYDLVNTRWGTHSIYGKMANVSNEVSPEGISNVGQFKMLTGGEDKVPAEDKGVSKYRFTVTQKFLFATNEFPEVENADEAFYNRLLFVEFPNSFSGDEDETLLDDLRDEASAIFNWMLEGLDRLRENGGSFTSERTIDDKRDITKAFGSPIEQFAHNALEVTNISEHVVHKKQLYAAFTRYCDFIQADRETQTKFTRGLKEESGISDGKSERVGDSGRTDVFKGVQLNKEFFKNIMADLPDHSYSEGSDNGQTSLDGH
jgi:P4 family phage/plasmid primase-like protien